MTEGSSTASRAPEPRPITLRQVQTLGTHVVDAFYVRDKSGQKVTEPRC